MIQTQVTIVEKETIGPAWWQLKIHAPQLTPQTQPGQFLFIRAASGDCYLRRPVFPAYLKADHFTLLLRPDPDPGLAWLLTQKPEDRLDVIGPLGVGFPLADGLRNLLLVGDSQAIGPLLGQMERAIQAGTSVTLALGGSRAANLYPVAALPPLVEFQASTLDGSLGHRGPLTDLLPELLRWADTVCTVGSTKLYRVLKTQVAAARLQAQAGYLYGVIADQGMACGVGACLSCTVETEAGLKLICLDGPVFDLATLNF